MDDKTLFERYVTLLERVVRARGADVSAVRKEYAWTAPERSTGPVAVAMSPLLTGSGSDIEFPPGDVI